ncbi:MAG: rod shape-determining protein MreC [Lachnospiraceae bacterium]|nr:rod shape-determining protein MreC [Lachnospiraceae bacterium]
MKFDKRKDINPKYLLLTLTIICIIFLLMSFFASDKIAAIKGFTGKIITPLQQGINEIGLWTDSKMDNLKKIEDLTAENEELKKKLAEYQSEITTYQNQLSELESLQELYELDALYPDYNKTGAHVFATDSSSWFSTFYIDKGTNDGLFVGANVMCGEGLAGLIVECYADYSKVRAIIDDNSNVSAKIMPSNALCTVEGNINTYQHGYLAVVNIDKDANISIGDKVVTSNISDRYHAGIVIGYVTNVENDPNNLTKTAFISPVVNFSEITEVLVITDTKTTIVTE